MSLKLLESSCRGVSAACDSPEISWALLVSWGGVGVMLPLASDVAHPHQSSPAPCMYDDDVTVTVIVKAHFSDSTII